MKNYCTRLKCNREEKDTKIHLNHPETVEKMANFLKKFYAEVGKV